VTGLACVRCRSVATIQQYLTACPACGALLDAVYDLHGDLRHELRAGGSGRDDADPLSRFARLLPLPLSAIPAGHGITSTPLIPLDATAGIPMPAWAKWEGAHPAGSA
jgi:hypothetical protein